MATKPLSLRLPEELRVKLDALPGDLHGETTTQKIILAVEAYVRVNAEKSYTAWMDELKAERAQPGLDAEHAQAIDDLLERAIP